MPIVKKTERKDTSVECRLIQNFYENALYNFERTQEFLKDAKAYKFTDDDFFKILYEKNFKVKYYTFEKSHGYLLAVGKGLGLNTFFTGLHSIQDIFEKSMDEASIRRRMKNMIDFYKKAQELGFDHVFTHKEKDVVDFTVKAGENFETDGKLKDKAYVVDEDGRFDRIAYKIEKPTFIISRDLETTKYTNYIDLFGNYPNVDAMPSKEDLFVNEIEDIQKLNKKEAFNHFNNKFETLLKKQSKLLQDFDLLRREATYVGLEEDLFDEMLKANIQSGLTKEEQRSMRSLFGEEKPKEFKIDKKNK